MTDDEFQRAKQKFFDLFATYAEIPYEVVDVAWRFAVITGEVKGADCMALETTKAVDAAFKKRAM